MKTDPIEVLRARITRAGSQSQLAQELGVSEGHLSDVLSGRRRPGPRLLAAIGLTQVVEYRRVR